MNEELRAHNAERVVWDYLGKIRELRQAVGESLIVLEWQSWNQPEVDQVIKALEEVMVRTWFPGADSEDEGPSATSSQAPVGCSAAREGRNGLR